MIQVELPFNEIQETVEHTLKYVSGKRAATAEDYFRHTICVADSGFIAELTGQAMLWLSQKICRYWRGHSFEKAVLAIRLDLPEDKLVLLQDQDILQKLLRQILIYRLLFLWLRISGMQEAERWGNGAEEMSEYLLTLFRKLTGLRERPISIF